MVSPAPHEYWQKRSGDFIFCREFAVRSVIDLYHGLSSSGIPSSGTPLAHRNLPSQLHRAVARRNQLMASQPTTTHSENDHNWLPAIVRENFPTIDTARSRLIGPGYFEPR